MKTKKFTYPPIHIGTSFMLVILIVLCMVTFAVLSLSGAIKDYEYSEKNARRNTEYYEANNLAEEKLAELVASMGSTEEEITFTVPINETERLQVTLRTHPQETPCYTILSWKQISTKDWAGSQTLPVLGGE